jgi:hypothetical protein
MNFLESGINGPGLNNFNANANGQYTFALVAYDQAGEVGRSAIQVNVDGTVVPEPSTYALMSAGLLGIFGVARRRKNKSSSVSPSSLAV